ncbi:SDR family oxidoreductase [Mucilaginibacter calamicampi]|uniref:SDR family oxidoreductase n=1 Tax=Mucilaginibacter calamicampi TaxID=1302352 RepID=A0ABW2YVY0_9SPHI
MVISILGCGWYGKALGAELIKKGITVNGSTTSSEKIGILKAQCIKPYLIDLSPQSKTIDDDFFSCDLLWISIPPRARAGRGMEYIAQIAELVGIINKHAIKHVVLISSTGVYGDNNTTVTELDEPNPDGESGKILLEAENILRSETDFTTTIIRFAGLIGPGRDPGRFFAGKTGIQNGDAPVNLIHLTDCVGVSCAIVEKQAFGNIYNASAPQHPSRAEFYTKAAERSGLEKPAFISEKRSWKIIDSVNVPTLLQYTYQVNLNE